MNSEFKIGDVVMLKSGSPHMTIYGFDECKKAMLVFWHDGDRTFVETGTNVTLLKLVE